MSIEKKSLISNSRMAKKANVAKAPGVAKVAAPKLNIATKMAKPHISVTFKVR